MERTLITGGAGFIGSHLADRLLSGGSEVIVIDNFSSGSRTNIAHLLDNPQFTLLEHDLTTPLPPITSGLSAIYHFASPASPNPNSPDSYINHPIETLLVNSLGTKNMLDLATANNCQIILASTSEVYGDPAVHPQTEDYWGNVSPNGERSCYDEGKRFLEAISFAYFRRQKTKVKVLRIFNTYGPRMRLDDGRFIPTIINAAHNHKPFVRFGDGNSTRSFCYIDDLLAGILAASQSDRSVGEVINLGNPTEFTINQAIAVLEEVIGRKLEVDGKPALPDDPKRRQPDISKAKNLLGWEPKVDLPTGLKKMLESYNYDGQS